MDINNFSIGVFVGRLQIHELHEGHHYAIKQVVDNHKKTIIFLGVPKFIGTKKNPLDFELVTVFENGEIIKEWTFEEIRERSKISID